MRWGRSAQTDQNIETPQPQHAQQFFSELPLPLPVGAATASFTSSFEDTMGKLPKLYLTLYQSTD